MVLKTVQDATQPALVLSQDRLALQEILQLLQYVQLEQLTVPMACWNLVSVKSVMMETQTVGTAVLQLALWRQTGPALELKGQPQSAFQSVETDL